MTSKRICIIGAGPAGMACLFNFAKNDVIPEMVCYEKQKTWGGQWNLTWRTGLDEHGENCHSSMYKDLWVNAPKEVNLEYPDYTFEQHFGKPIPSYPPVAVIRDYLEGRFTKGSNTDLKNFIRFNTVVRYVRYQDAFDNYIVTVEDLENHVTINEIFSHVIVCTGIFNFPNVPEFPVVHSFKGRILPAHSFRNASEFKGQRVLLIGSSFSATDIAITCLKYGAKHIIISYRGQSTGVVMPKDVEERPLVEKFDERKAYFKDGSGVEIDSVILCTGYKNHFPFLESRLRIADNTSIYPKELYKATLFIEAGRNNLFYCGVQYQLYTMVYFDVTAQWITKYIMDKLPREPVSKAKMEAYSQSWARQLPTLTSLNDMVDFQTALLKDLISDTGYSTKVLGAPAIFKQWAKDREDSIADYRNQRFRSMYTGTLAPNPMPHMEAFDNSVEAFLQL